MVPVLFSRVLEGSVHDGGEQGSGEAFKFCLLLRWGECDICVGGHV